MDQRDILLLVDEITKNRFHTLLRISYEAVPVNHTMRGKIYGGDPTIQVVMLAETYRPLMPDAVLEELELQRPAGEEETDEDEG